jgi:hypothetical protein
VPEDPLESPAPRVRCILYSADLVEHLAPARSGLRNEPNSPKTVAAPATDHPPGTSGPSGTACRVSRPGWAQLQAEAVEVKIDHRGVQSVSIWLTIRPLRMAMPSRRRSSPSSRPIANGKAPRIAAAEVIMMELRRGTTTALSSVK